MIKVTIGILSAHLMIFALALESGALIDDFNDGNFDGWKVQAENWKVENGEIKFSAGGDCGASLYYEDGADWTDYEFEVDMKLANLSDFPGGIRVRLNPKTARSNRRLALRWAYGRELLYVGLSSPENHYQLCSNRLGL